MKNTKTTKAVKTATTPANHKPKVAKLLKVEQTFIDTFDGIFNGVESVRATIRKWLKNEAQHKHIVAVAEYYKATNEAKMKSFKAQVSQVAKEIGVNLSLQGLGKKQTAKIAKTKKAVGGKDTGKGNDKDTTKDKQTLKVDDYVKVAQVFNEDDYAEAVFKLADGLTKAQKQALKDQL